MEVLSCSEVQYAGETNCPQRSPDLKPTEKHEDGVKLMRIDSLQIKRSDELLLDTNKEEQPPTGLDCTPPIRYVVQSNNGKGLLDVNISQQSCKGILLNGVTLHLDSLRNSVGDEPSNDFHERKANFVISESSGQIGCALPNGTHLEATILGTVGHSDEAVSPKLHLRSNHPESQLYGIPSQVSQSGRSDISAELEKIFPGLKEAQRDMQSDDKGVVQVGQSCDTSQNVVLDVQHKRAEELANCSLEPSNILDKEDGNLCLLKEEYPSGNKDFNEFEQGKLDPQERNQESASLNKDETNVPNRNRVTDGSSLDAESQEQDETVALWVKWRGKWQAGIRCARADWPLSTVKAKPTHGRKKYFVVFFPNTRTHSWADMLLVRSISDLPEPLAYGTHFSGLEMVKDLTTPRRYIMQKLAVSMLNVSDQLHNEAVIERARQVAAWKEFALEAYNCEAYSDLGTMLLKLHSMILPAYMDPDWLEQSFDTWANCCEHAQSAESVETLLKELVESVLWDQVESLWDAPVQPKLGSEWKTWKQEVLKWFSTSHPPLAAPGESSELRNCDESSTSSGHNVSRKRPKLEIRRAEAHNSQVDMETDQVNIDSGFFTSGHSDNVVIKEESFTDCPSGGGDGWVEIVVEAGNPDFTRNVEEAGPPVDTGSGTKVLVDANHGSHATNKYRQCLAFIAAKGRQCGRWANDGEIYCCVHLNCRYAEKAAKVEETPPSFSNAMCEGTTNHGERCKHRARFGSLFCKKHRPQGSQMGSGNPSVSPGNDLKRKFSETNSSLENIPTLDIITSKEMVLVGGQRPFMGNLNAAFEVEAPQERNGLIGKPIENYGASSSATVEGYIEEWPCCIVWGHENNCQCPEKAKLHTLYCEKHRPNFLKRARNGKSRIISKEHFLDLLKNCTSRNQKVQLHQACELLYGFMRSALNRRNRVSKEHLMEWILSEASKDLSVGDYLMRLVSLEKEKIEGLWQFDVEKGRQSSSALIQPVVHPVQAQDRAQSISIVKCKICAEDFIDEKTLGAHWMDVHKKEAQWLFRGYACAICMNSFTNRKVLEVHVKEKHKIQSLDQCILFQCMPCGDQFVNPEQLWVHVLSFHSTEFRLRTSSEQQTQVPVQQAASQTLSESGKNPGFSTKAAAENNDEIQHGARRFICRFCGLKFDLLPDLGRHHQAAHMGPNATSHFPSKRRSLFSAASRLRPGRPGRSRFKKGLGGAFPIGNNSSFSLKKELQGTDSLSSSSLKLLTQVSEVAAFERSIKSQCSAVAEVLFKDIKQTKPRPTNLEILSVARSTCCKVALLSVLEQTFGVLPERLYLKAAKLCSELNVQVEWHCEGFICPQGCVPVARPDGLSPLDNLPDSLLKSPYKECSVGHADSFGEWEMEECHHVITSKHLEKPLRKVTILCEDISFGRERTPVACVVDEDLEFQPDLNGQKTNWSMPWEGFSYVTERKFDPSLGLDTKSSQLGCACPHPNCSPETCDHVYLFDNDYESAKDLLGKPMHGRFPYDEVGRIILEEGYLVYECNSMCRCDRTCRNRVLQNGVQLKLEIFKTKKKGWAVRAGEAIPHGTFVCEYIGELLNDQEADKRGERYDHEGCSYLYDIDAHIDDMGGMNEESVPYVIDATKYGNVARFINHSCSPNLVNYQVLVESMDCQLAHIGLYANRDIAKGEELAYDYHYKLLPGEGCPCHCGASNCRGRLY
ncbi:histone-lysine N-methyltransferase SUVR5 [Aristolochia californica]|uniref:histone-lysine N-methyltransferase SUVR5 n=1 Tax=Aristolochia californica TaxID=171875 RepID=UPI0035DF63FA